MRIKTWQIGIGIWLLLAFSQPSGLYHEWWARLLLLLAALVWVPLAFSLLEIKNQILHIILLPAAILLTSSMFFSTGYRAVGLALPWWLVTLFFFQNGWQTLAKATKWTPSVLAIAAAQMFLLVGSTWVLADRLGIEPLGFSSDIVLLTGIHFHYAGFIFPLLVGLAAQAKHSTWLQIGSLLSVVSVPLTAIGITATQLYETYWLETIAALLVVFAGWSTAIGYLHWIFRQKMPKISQLLWSMMSVALLASMTLALLYALRYWWMIEWLNIPAMRALHGTLNAVIVSGFGLFGWHFFNKSPLHSS